MAGAHRRLLVVTDLDGTLLDGEYRWEEARGSVERLRQLGFPLVLNSSKTVAEMIGLAGELKTNAPLIAENGGLIAIHEDSVPARAKVDSIQMSGYQIRFLGRSRQEILETARALRESGGYSFEGFADWSDCEIAERTGLRIEQAQLSAQRLATEPILWQDGEARWDEFISLLEGRKIRAIRGGRFIHLMGMADKASAMLEVKRIYTDRYPQSDWTLVALGDSPNDQQMLSAADIAVVIPDAHGRRLAPTADRVIQATASGPAGWHASMWQILDEFS